MAYELVCVQCGARHDGSKYRLACDQCSSLLDVVYDTPATTEARLVPDARGTARYLPMLPIVDPANLVTMGEGNTALVVTPRIGQSLGIDDLYIKLECANPTGSFKDRGNAVQVSVLKETGVTAVADSTGGNAGHSFAAYCARAGIRFVGFAEEGNTSRKLQAIAFHGTEIHFVKGDRYARAAAVRKFCEDTGVLYMNYGRNAYFIEGQKTMAYEIPEQMERLPDHIIVPIGNGSILHGLWRGFQEMLEDGRVQRIPHLHGAQTEETQPLVAAFNRKKWSPPPGGATSVANGIGVPQPPRLDALVQVCRQSGGRPVAVSEADIIAWQRRLAELEGLFVEPTSAIVLGAAQTLRQQGVIRRGDSVLLPLTGFGTKEPIPGQ